MSWPWILVTHGEPSFLPASVQSAGAAQTSYDLSVTQNDCPGSQFDDVLVQTAGTPAIDIAVAGLVVFA